MNEKVSVVHTLSCTCGLSDCIICGVGKSYRARVLGIEPGHPDHLRCPRLKPGLLLVLQLPAGNVVRSLTYWSKWQDFALVRAMCPEFVQVTSQLERDGCSVTYYIGRADFDAWLDRMWAHTHPPVDPSSS